MLQLHSIEYIQFLVKYSKSSDEFVNSVLRNDSPSRPPISGTENCVREASSRCLVHPRRGSRK